MSDTEADLAGLRAAHREIERLRGVCDEWAAKYEGWMTACLAAEAKVARVEALADEWEADDEESLDTFGQHLMGGSVLTCAELLRAALADPGDERGRG